MRAWPVVAVLSLLAGGAWWMLRAGEPGVAPTTASSEEVPAPEAAGAPPPSLAPRPGGGPAPAMGPDVPGDGSGRADPAGEPDTAALARARMEGVVLDEAGRPVPGARVRVTPHIVEVDDVVISPGAPEPEGPPVLLCGADGRFVIPELRAGRPYCVEAQSALHAGATVETPPAESGQVLPVEVRLLPARFLELVILDAATAAPIVGAKVTGVQAPIPLPGQPEPSAPKSDVSGRIHVGPAALGAVDLAIEAEGYLKASRSIPAGSEGVIEVNLVRALSLSGRVLRSDGSPAVGARVALRFGPDAITVLHTAGWLSTETDAEGRFTFSGLPRLPVPLEASFQSPTVEGVAAPEPETGSADPEAGTSDCVIRLSRAGELRAGALTIHVVDPDGHPVPRASITIRSDRMSIGTSLSDGCFVYDRPVAAGASVLHVSISGASDTQGTPLPLAGAQVDVPTSQSEVTIRLERSEPIRGVVRGPDGVPVAGAAVQLFSTANPQQPESVAYAQTADDGTFSLVGDAHVPGRVVVLPYGRYLAPEPVDAGPGATGLELRMRLGAEAVVTVLDAGGTPLAGVKLQASDEDKPEDRAMRRGEDTQPSGATDAQGRATLVGLDPSHRYRLSATPTIPGSRGVTTEHWVPADTTVRLPRVLRISGIVRDRAGRPLPTAMVEWMADDNLATQQVDGAGRFAIDGLPDGPVRLRAGPFPRGEGVDVAEEPPPPAPVGNGAPSPSEDADPWLTVPAGTTDVVLTLDLGATLLVRVEGWSPEEAAGASPFWSDREALLEPEGPLEPRALHRAPLADDGTIRFHRLDPTRTYTLWISPVGDRSLRKTGVRAGADLRVRLETGKTLSILIVGPGPIESASLSFAGCPLSLPWRPFRSDGSADLRGYPPGRYTVKAQCVVNGVPHAGQATVEAGGPRVDLPVAPAAAEGR